MLGDIRNGIVGLSDIGNIAAVDLQKIPEIHELVLLDEFIVMPNHIHCILEIVRRTKNEWRINQFAKPLTGSVSTIINQFKGAVTKWCNNNGVVGFEWQGRFHDHVIRNDREYWMIKNYIINNPARWQKDKFHP